MLKHIFPMCVFIQMSHYIILTIELLFLVTFLIYSNTQASLKVFITLRNGKLLKIMEEKIIEPSLPMSLGSYASPRRQRYKQYLPLGYNSR